MRWFALLGLLVFATNAAAGSSEQHYLELRDRYIAQFAKAPDNDETTRQHDAAIKELTAVLRGLVGPVTIPGLPAEGSSNVDTLYKGDMGFGHLDGLSFASDGDKTQVVVTTTGLLQHWLREHRDDGMPQEIEAALKSDHFYYAAIQDSAFAKYAELPIAKPAAASAAVAVLGLRANGGLKGRPDEIDVLVVQGEKVFFLAARDLIKTAPVPACETVWKQAMAKPVDKKDPNGDMTREDNAVAAFTQCFAKAAPNQSWFAAAVRKAQSQIDLLPLR